MNIQSGAKSAVLAAAVALSLMVPGVAAAQSTGRQLNKLPPATAELGTRLLSQLSLANVNRDVRELLAMMQIIVSRTVLNRDVILDSSSGLREVGRIPLRPDTSVSGRFPPSITSTGVGGFGPPPPFPGVSSGSSTFGSPMGSGPFNVRW